MTLQIPRRLSVLNITPNLDTIVFEWDGTSDYAVFTDTFRYKAKDADGTITGTLNDALADYDPDNADAGRLFDDVLTVVPMVNAPTANGGTVNLNTDGSFVYTPLADNKTGIDSFAYTLQDGFGGTAAAAVTFTLSNQLPKARPNN